MSEMPPDDGSAGEETPAEEPLPPFPPEPIDGFLQGEASAEAESTGVGNLGTYMFCFSLDGRYWGQQPIQSPSTEGAQVSANQLARLLHDMLRRLGYGEHTVTAYPC